MSKKMWSGRFKSETDETVNSFNSSIKFDSKMFREDIQGSIAHARMLSSCDIISQEEGNKIIAGLQEILTQMENGSLKIDPESEDIHMFIEEKLTELIGDTGKKLHTGRSRNDQVALDIKLYLKKDMARLTKTITEFIKTILDIASGHTDTIMPGYTHLQRAQPITFAHHLLAYVQMFLRDLSRISDCRDRMNYSPLGAGALAGTTYPLDRQSTARDLGFIAPTINSMDSVSDRDHLLEYANILSIIMVHLSRFSEEIILWSSKEFGFIELDDRFSTGSSIMPQKKNPDVAELTRGKSGRVFGNNMALLTMMKGLPLAYNKDMQEDKEAIFDSMENVHLCLLTFKGMIETMAVNKKQMRQAAEGGFTNATDLADYFTKKGMPFRDSHEITGKIVAFCIENNTTLEKIPLEKYKEHTPLADNDLYEAISLETCVNKRNIQGGPARESVLAQINYSYSELNKYIG